MKKLRNKIGGAAFLLIALCCTTASAQTLTINGAQTRQTIDGFGANINHYSWDTNGLPTVLNALIDEGGLTLFRVIFDNTDWETNNDNGDSAVMNWTNYNAIYGSQRFEKLWGIIGWLNERGISNGITLNFQGPGPAWMGQPLHAGYEDEWAEMITSLLMYARNTRHLQFGLVAPDNEPDLDYEGIQVSGASQYVTMLHALALKLDANGLGDIRLVGPDRSSGAPAFMPEMLNDPVVMAKVAHFGVHSYWEGGSGSSDVYSLIQSSAYPDRSFWMTEFSVWCASCEGGSGNTSGWSYFRDIVSYLMDHLDNGAAAGLIWEGYDSQYETLDLDWSYWGLFGVNNINANPKTYTPRKSLYSLAQLARFARPGARRLGMSGSTSLAQLEAFYHPGTGQFTIVGINTANNAVNLSAALASLPPVAKLGLYYTDANTNLARGATVPVSNGVFNASIPANSVFTLVGFNPAMPPVGLNVAPNTNGVTLSWTNTVAGLVLESTTSAGPGAVWSTITNTPHYTSTQWQVTIAPTNAVRFFRLRGP